MASRVNELHSILHCIIALNGLDSSMAASTSMSFLRRLCPNEAWLLVLRAVFLTADFMRVSVTRRRSPDAAHCVVVTAARPGCRLRQLRGLTPGLGLSTDLACYIDREFHSDLVWGFFVCFFISLEGMYLICDYRCLKERRFIPSSINTKTTITLRDFYWPCKGTEQI